MALLAAPNISEGRDAVTIAAIRAALDRRRAVLDRHSDRDHNRTVFTLAGEPFVLEPALEAGLDEAIERIDMRRHRGLHPCVGALDVCPLIWIAEEDRGTARERAMSVAEWIARRDVPVFLYGDLATSAERMERAYFREGGLPRLAERMAAGKLRADLGPEAPHPTAGATLITARPPLVAFNVELDTADAAIAQRIAAGLRESGGGPAGRAGDRPGAGDGPGPGVDERARPGFGAAAPCRRAGPRAGRRTSAPDRSRRSWSASPRRRRSPTTRPTFRSAASTRRYT